ncbi:MAG: protein-L-isoaspartate O-methyltransferase family protein [Intrasporangium sp.]|uniref:protein-L-isoaspartate O-methyltransferase family protein n=1 Tax=Intrasporangium sp. TaxID=1925024 RepID=UPI003F802690
MEDRTGDALSAVPRAAFLHASDRWRADADGPIPIGHGQTSSQPRTVEAMLRLLEVRPGDRVLDIGSGSGWTTALLAWLAGPTGAVLGLEIEPELVQWGRENLARAGCAATIREARPGVLGAPDDGPWDRILVSADAGRFPQALVDQLAADGRLVAPVAGWLTLVERTGGQVRTSEHGPYRFVPLR